MTKVTVKQEVAKAIEHFRGLEWENVQIAALALHQSGPYPRPLAMESVEHARTLGGNPDGLIRALYFGYETEKSLEMALLDYANDHEFWDGLGDRGEGFKAALLIVSDRMPGLEHVKRWAEDDFKNWGKLKEEA